METAPFFLDKLQTQQDEAGYTIRFFDEQAAPTESVQSIVEYAITYMGGMPDTIKVGPKRYRRQSLGASRSIEDLYLLCKHYHPMVQIREVTGVLRALHNARNLKWWFCSTHRKMMFRKEKTYYSNSPSARLYEID